MSNSKTIVIAIDGGAAAGKSSTSRGLSERFNLMHVDTGSFYRAITLKLLQAKIPAVSDDALNAGLAQFELRTEITGQLAAISIDGWVPDASIRSEEVNNNVSHYAALPEVRAFLLDYQRKQTDVARDNQFNGLVIEGRDIGSVVFPDADLKLFMYADPEKRAARRAKEGIIDDLAKRDAIDSSRKAAPLSRPEGSVLVDSSDLTLEEVIEHVASLVSNLIKN